MGILIQQPPFQNVVAGGKANLPNLHIGDRCDMLQLTLGGTFTIAQMTSIKVKLGGVPIVETTGSHLQDINEYLGRGVTSTIIPIWFANPNAKTIVGYEQGAIETDKGYSSFTIEVDIAGAAINPTLSCKMLKGVPKLNRKDANVFRGLVTNAETLGVTGKQTASPPLGGPAALIERVHFFHSNITQLEVKKQSQELLSDMPVADIQYLQNELNRTTQSGHLVFDPVVLNHVSDQLTKTRVMPNGQLGVASLEFNPTLSGSDDVTMYGELIGDISTF